MRKFFTVLAFLSLLASCNSPEKKPEEVPGATAWTDLSTLPKAGPVTPAAREVLEGWPQFLSLEERMATLPQVESREALELLLEELTQICRQVEENAIPGPFERPSVRSRLKVIRTYLGKADAALFYRQDPKDPLLELMAAYNALRGQFNILVSTTLNPEMFEND